MMDLLWGSAQEGKMAEARTAAYRASSKASHVAQYVGLLEQRLDKLSLICRAMWSFLQEATNVTEEALVERVKQIDLADGKLDGKVTREAALCEKCGRMMSPHRPVCLWCGAERLSSSAFDKV